jgi:hypothetical protein
MELVIEVGMDSDSDRLKERDKVDSHESCSLRGMN